MYRKLCTIHGAEGSKKQQYHSVIKLSQYEFDNELQIYFPMVWTVTYKTDQVKK